MFWLKINITGLSYYILDHYIIIGKKLEMFTTRKDQVTAFI